MAGKSRGGGREGMWVLSAAIFGSAMIFVDGTAVNVALPVLQRELGASAQQVQWVVEGYSLFLAALLLIGGALGDIFGRRLVYGIGVALFALASVACGLAPTPNTLIVGRCIQGIGGALATPGSLALIAANFDGEARGRAIGTWSGFSSITAAIGPLIGGWLVQTFSWRAVFFINIPIAVAVIAILIVRVDESRNPSASHRVDLAGATLATVGLGLLVYGLIGLQGVAPVGLNIAAIVAGCVALIAFIIVEQRIAEPMMQLALFRSRTFAVANLYTLFLYAALGGSLYFLPFELINVQGYSPAAAGAAMLPFILIMFLASRWSGGLVARIGPRTPLVLGAVIAGVGFAGFAFTGIGRSYWLSFFLPALVLGIGGALFVAPLTTSVMDAVEKERSGLASGINNTVSRAAGLLAIALLGVVLATTFSGRIERALARSPGVSQATRDSADRDRTALLAGHIPPSITNREQRAIVTRAVATAYHGGFGVVMLVTAGLCFIAALVAFAFLPKRIEPEPVH